MPDQSTLLRDQVLYQSLNLDCVFVHYMGLGIKLGVLFRVNLQHSVLVYFGLETFELTKNLHYFLSYLQN